MADNNLKMEKLCLRKIDLFYHQAREEDPQSKDFRGVLEMARDIRQEYEMKFSPLLTRITGDNLSVFSDMIPERLREEISFNKSMGLGLLRTEEEDRSLYAASAAVFSVDEAAEDMPVLRIKWFYVHPLCRRKGNGNALMGELISLMIKNKIPGATIDLPSDMDDPLLKGLLEKWHFNFYEGMDPDFVIRLSDLKDPEVFSNMNDSVKPFSSVDKSEAQKIVKRAFKQDGYKGFLKNRLDDYIDYGFSCFIREKEEVTAIMLSHVFDGKELIVEYTYSEQGKELKILELLMYMINEAGKRFDGSLSIRMRTNGIGPVDVLDEVFPRQQTVDLTEGVLII